MNNNLNFEAVKGYHINLRKLNNDQTKFITENLIKDYRDFEGENNLFHYGFSAPNNEYRFFNFTCFSLGQESEEISFDEYMKKLNSHNPTPKLIGYKLVKEEYLKAVNSICNHSEDFEFFLKNILHSNNYECNKLKQSGVLDLWFDKVYESSTEQKIIDCLSWYGIEITKEQAEHIIKIVNEK